MDDARVSDAERERALILLRQATVDGRLTTEELLERTEAALTAQTRGELAAVTRDLGRSALPATRLPATRRIQAVLGETKQAGHWRAEGQVDVLAVMADCKVDLLDAEIVGSELVLQVNAIMADVKIYVPEDVPVVLEAATVLSSVKEDRANVDPAPDAPTIRITGFALMSSLQVVDEEVPLVDRLNDMLYGRGHRRARRRAARATERLDR
ncbi:DUF1707 domain-containing protein [Sphaerobacter sp.]|uniref:DUF1707 SHOCT-like domain-containing protein n=1 Tax=Sphaerobacter sp. TaxID=2099654 RepID=UPI001D7D3FC3|nr:DUF1707 domain-containing protein [Sphaerobacter sp.]MBX5445240.1 DUF1707 and DUF2154 domain-containing protein [Sphaerobacter sp.]